ncbi:hypothetical protein PMI36_03582, partial [Pseudomonas sp. GM79]
FGSSYGIAFIPEGRVYAVGVGAAENCDLLKSAAYTETCRTCFSSSAFNPGSSFNCRANSSR